MKPDVSTESAPSGKGTEVCAGGPIYLLKLAAPRKEGMMLGFLQGHRAKLILESSKEADILTWCQVISQYKTQTYVLSPMQAQMLSPSHSSNRSTPQRLPVDSFPAGSHSAGIITPITSMWMLYCVFQ